MKILYTTESRETYRLKLGRSLPAAMKMATRSLSLAGKTSGENWDGQDERRRRTETKPAFDVDRTGSHLLLHVGWLRQQRSQEAVMAFLSRLRWQYRWRSGGELGCKYRDSRDLFFFLFYSLYFSFQKGTLKILKC